MARINVLKPEVYNLISAGEVVEKPVGALKELVENSIDAGARRITIEVSGGGFELISVSDNGCGLYEEDLELAFVKHATSKLEYADDLFAVQTLGFRGEALSSIAAVSRVKLTTRVSSADTGVCITVENGVVGTKQYVTANVGTKIEIRDLFYNTPGRKKFFKSPQREASEITKFVATLMLTNPNLEISYSLDGNKVYETNGNGLQEAIYAIYGADCLSHCLEVNFSRDNLIVHGYIGDPEYTKANRNYQTLAVNGRCVSDQNISGAIMQAYKQYLMTRQFPFYVLNLEIPCDCVDVNVHPKKSEVRFANINSVCGAFYRAVHNALEKFAEQRVAETFSGRSSYDENVPVLTQEEYREKFRRIMEEHQLEVMTPHQTEAVEAMEQSTLEEERKKSFEEFTQMMEREVTVANVRRTMGLDDPAAVSQYSVTVENLQPPSPPIQEYDPADELFDRAKILGAAFRTYLILEIDDKVIFVDQHAAHERMLFDKFLQQKSQTMQPVLFPYVFTVSEDEANFIEENRENILAAGLEVEPFGHNTYRITAVSTLLADTKMDEFVQYLLSGIEEYKLDERQLIVEKIAKKACKAAVKAGYALNEYEIKYILKEVCDNKILQCPHGRPITVVFSKSQLEKMFKRIV